MIKPIFILSLPRSGSTLLQNLLMNHSSVSSIAEPWILLPLVYVKKKDGVLSEYSHLTSQNAIKNLIDSLPNKEDDYNIELRNYILNIYKKLSSSKAIYFLDKTPRYFLIIEEIQALFPESKFVFLLRNPLDILSSMLITWKNNSFLKLFKNNIDIYEGPKRLSFAINKYREKSFILRYEDLIEDPKKSMKDLLKYLDLTDADDLLNTKRNQSLSDVIGDPNLGIKYNSISKESLNRWKKVFNNRFRIWFIKRYITKIDNDFLLEQGINKKYLLEDISKSKVSLKGNIRDLFSYVISFLCFRYKVNLLISKAHNWLKKKYVS